MKKLQIFDLDDTILRIPTFSALNPNIAIAEYDSNPYIFYDSAESLDYSKYNIQLIEPVYQEYLNWKGKSYQALITHRVPELAGELADILIKIDMTFDEIKMLGRKSEKSKEVNKILEKNREIMEIEIFEDSLIQIESYQKNIKLEPHQTLTFWFVDKSKMFKIGNINLTDHKRINLKTI
jgi:hypothetical protein